MDIYSWLWLAWGLMFFAIEIPAMRKAWGGRTLSEKIWKFLGRGEPLTWSVKIRRIIFLGGWGALTMHFIFLGEWL